MITIPKLNIANALSVTAGSEHIGWVCSHGGSWFAFTPDRELHGEYPSQSEAMRSLPPVLDQSGARRRRARNR